jgi:hypothetical protein
MREMGPTGSGANPLIFRKLLFRNTDNGNRRENVCPWTLGKTPSA